MEEMKAQKQERKDKAAAQGKLVDIDFNDMIEEARSGIGKPLNHVSSANMNICVCVRKRPLFEKETMAGEMDSVSVFNPRIQVHEPKVKVDGITKFVQNHEFTFDNTYGNKESSQHVYEFQIKPLIPTLFNKGVVTLFAYGQTGSGKTFTISDATKRSVHDIFMSDRKDCTFYMSFFEIYGGQVFDLLNSKKKLLI
jgi:kinesin family protein 2/24